MQDPSNIRINARSIAEILAMPAQNALLLLEAAKSDFPILHAAHEYELANKNRFEFIQPVRAWMANAPKPACPKCGKPMIYANCRDFHGWSCMSTALCVHREPIASTPKPCPACNVAPVIKNDSVHTAGQIYVACSNELDCSVWPIGYPADQESTAVDHWNNNHYI